MSQAAGLYALTTAELPAVRQLLLVQKTIGVDVAPSPTYEMTSTLMDGVRYFSLDYPALANGRFKGWADQLYAGLIGTPTCYGHNFPELFVVFAYGRYVIPVGGLPRYVDGKFLDPEPGYDFYTGFSRGLTDALGSSQILFSWKQQGPRKRGDWYVGYPAAPAAWVAAVDGVLTTWGTTPPAAIINPGDGPNNADRVREFEDRVVSSGWTDFNRVTDSTGPVWKSQLDAMQELLQAAGPGEEGYFFLLHLLIALATGPAAGRQLALQIIEAPAGSPEYPNETFLNQVVYLALISLADPLGAYGWSNAQLQQFVKDLAGAAPSNDPVSTAVRASLARHGKILFADTAYPLQDPYSPTFGFTQRKTDTLFALDKARADLREEAHL